ncbi:MAG: RNA-binding protein [Patescibacteria group bacterium]
MEAVNNKKLYVGNLSWGVNDDSLRAAFGECGEVTSAQVSIDRMTGRSRGFAFVEFANEADAAAAVERWNGQELDGRPLRVNVAMPREEGAQRRPYTGGGASRGGFGGGAPRRDDNRGGYGRDNGGNNRSW